MWKKLGLILVLAVICVMAGSGCEETEYEAGAGGSG